MAVRAAVGGVAISFIASITFPPPAFASVAAAACSCLAVLRIALYLNEYPANAALVICLFVVGCCSTGPCMLSLLQALRAVSSVDGGLSRLLQHSKLLLQLQRCPAYAALRSEAVDEVAAV